MATERLTEYLTEALAKGETQEGRRGLREERERLEAEAPQEAQEPAPRKKAPPDALEAAKDVLQASEGFPKPPEVLAEPRVDPILPVLKVHSVNEHSAVEAGRLAFGGLGVGRDDLANAQLPLLPGTDGPRVSLLDLADVRGGPIMARGRGAPLDLRLLVAACIMTPHDSRKGLLQLAVPVRQLRDFCFPNGWERRRDWPAIRRAMWKSRDFVIPDGRGGLWLPFHLMYDPGPDATLDDLVRFFVTFPQGSAHGPVIDRRKLAQLGVGSAPRFRAYIAAHSVQWHPGRTRVVSPKAGGRRVWTSNQDAYTILTAEDRRRLAYGATDKGHRTRAGPGGVDTPWEALPGTVILTCNATTQDGSRGWVIVPKAAAEAIERKGANHRMRGR